MKILENFFLAFLGFLKAQFLMVQDTFLSCFLWLSCRCFLIMLLVCQFSKIVLPLFQIQGVLATYWASAGIEDFSAADV
jgi:hypothetical protein